MATNHIHTCKRDSKCLIFRGSSPTQYTRAFNLTYLVDIFQKNTIKQPHSFIFGGFFIYSPALKIDGSSTCNKPPSYLQVDDYIINNKGGAQKSNLLNK